MIQADISDPYYNQKMKIIYALYAVMDPELGINIMDMGLVYDIEFNEEAKEINIIMTLSTPACPVGGAIVDQVGIAVEKEYPDYRTDVALVWDPPWGFDHISDAGREALGYN